MIKCASQRNMIQIKHIVNAEAFITSAAFIRDRGVYSRPRRLFETAAFIRGRGVYFKSKLFLANDSMAKVLKEP